MSESDFALGKLIAKSDLSVNKPKAHLHYGKNRRKLVCFKEQDKYFILLKKTNLTKASI